MTDVVSLPLNTRLVQAAARLTGEVGWSAVTMARLAEAVGVSRQTVYNEVGGREALAEAMVLHELAVFLERVDASFEKATDVVEAIRGASCDVLRLAQTDPLLRAILSSSHGKSTDLLPLLTTESAGLLDIATRVIRQHVDRFDIVLDEQLDERRLDACIEMVVRLVLSHVMQPSGTPEDTADDIAWISAKALGL